MGLVLIWIPWAVCLLNLFFSLFFVIGSAYFAKHHGTLRDYQQSRSFLSIRKQVRAGVTHGGRWCDVFEIRDWLIQRCFIYLDPDYAGLDTARYPWLSAAGRDASKPMG